MIVLRFEDTSNNRQVHKELLYVKLIFVYICLEVALLKVTYIIESKQVTVLSLLSFSDENLYLPFRN
jgi:hypothetical protein